MNTGIYDFFSARHLNNVVFLDPNIKPDSLETIGDRLIIEAIASNSLLELLTTLPDLADEFPDIRPKKPGFYECLGRGTDT